MKLFRYRNKIYKVSNIKEIAHVLYKQGSYYDEFKIIPSCIDDSYYNGTEWQTTFQVYASDASRIGQCIGYCNFYEKGTQLIC